jgi:tetratricopeptide (TPR) repeat protein
MLALLMTDAQPEARMRRLEGALELSRSVRSPVLETQIVGHFGLLHASDGRLDEAMICCQQAVERSREIGNLLEEARSLISLAHVQYRQGEKDLAAENVGIAQALFLSQGFEVSGSDGP